MDVQDSIIHDIKSVQNRFNCPCPCYTLYTYLSNSLPQEGDPSFVKASQAQEGYFLQAPESAFEDKGGDSSFIKPSQVQEGYFLQDP